MFGTMQAYTSKPKCGMNAYGWISEQCWVWIDALLGMRKALNEVYYHDTDLYVKKRNALTN